MTQAERIQAYLRATATAFYEAVPVPPFTAFFSATDPLRYLNYAIPDEPAGGDLTEPLETLREMFRSRGRLPRFEYVAGFAPELAASLDAAGFEVELDAPLMTCPHAEVVDPPSVPGLEIVAAANDPRAAITVGNRSFGSPDAPEATDDEVEGWLARRSAADGAALLGLLDGEPVAIASAAPPRDGLSEVAGVGVVEHARNRGIGSAMTAAAARGGAARGAELLFLSPGSEAAQSIYRRVGFRPAERTLYYVDPA
ncbi:MAG TPA: GNAT family N-acetyltransferase [Gaiellaceae bacterium]|nr:GNAT family N-acetyltransferase [Gaiellaceae bacterium]